MLFRIENVGGYPQGVEAGLRYGPDAEFCFDTTVGNVQVVNTFNPETDHGSPGLGMIGTQHLNAITQGLYLVKK